MKVKVFKESFKKPDKKVNEEVKSESNLPRAEDYWANEVLFQAEEAGIELKDGLEVEIANRIIDDDYIWEQINERILDFIKEMNESCKKVDESESPEEKRTGHTEGKRLPELK